MKLNNSISVSQKQANNKLNTTVYSCLIHQVGENKAEPANKYQDECADSMIPLTPPFSASEEPRLPKGWETAPKCPRFRLIEAPKPQISVSMTVKVRRPVGEDDDASKMVSTLLPFALEESDYDRNLRAKGGVIVGSPPCWRREMRWRARRYDPQWS